MADGGVWTKIYPDVASLGGGKVLQVVRATDSAKRETASATYVPAGISVKVTPTNSTSTIILIYNALIQTPETGAYTQIGIFDSSDNPVSGAENVFVRDTNPGNIRVPITQFGVAKPGVTSEVTYKVSFLAVGNGYSGIIHNDLNIGQLYAIELEDVVVSP